jgi:methyl-accepting chemotaxis protein
MQISKISAAIGAAVEQQRAAAKEIASNVQQAAAGSDEVVDSIGQVNRGAVDTGAAAEKVRGSSEALTSETGRLTEAIHRFAMTMRAA